MLSISITSEESFKAAVFGCRHVGMCLSLRSRAFHATTKYANSFTLQCSMSEYTDDDDVGAGFAQPYNHSPCQMLGLLTVCCTVDQEGIRHRIGLGERPHIDYSILLRIDG